MIEVRSPKPMIVDQSTGEPTLGFSSANDEAFEVRVQEFGDRPDGGCNYLWMAEPAGCVEWLDERFEFKRKFRIRANGRVYAILTDRNGYTYNVPSIGVRRSVYG